MAARTTDPETGGPPKKRMPAPAGTGTRNQPQSGKPRDNDSTCYARSLRVRRSASYRLPGGDPWIYPALTDGYERAVLHLTELGLTPAPNVEALRAMHRRGGRQRRAAERIAEAWSLTA